MNTEWGVNGEGEREKESSGLMEWETEHWTEIEMALVGNGGYWKSTPEYFKKVKSTEQI